MSDISEGYHDYVEELEEEERKYHEKIQNELTSSEIQELEEADCSYTPEEIERLEKQEIINTMSANECIYGTQIAQEEYNKILLSDNITPIFIPNNLKDDQTTNVFNKHTYAYDALIVIEHELSHKFIYRSSSTSESDDGFMYQTLFAIPVKNIWIKIMNGYLERDKLNKELAKDKDIYKKWLRFVDPEYCKKWDTNSIKPKVLTNINDFSKRDILDILSRKKKEELVIEFSSEDSEIVNLKDIYDTAVLYTAFSDHDFYTTSALSLPAKICKSYKEKLKKEGKQYIKEDEIPF